MGEKQVDAGGNLWMQGTTGRYRAKQVDGVRNMWMQVKRVGCRGKQVNAG